MGVQNIEYGQRHERLEALLQSVDRPGDYCVGGRIYTPMPRVVVQGVGDLSFPVPEAQCEALIGVAERAPFGKGARTVVDPSVRDCWQIDARKVRLSGRGWEDSFAKIMGRVAEGLGLPADRLRADPYKLLVYRPGGFFAEHRDTEKAPGMVATLSLSLPASGEGGDLAVRHRERETVFDASAREPSELVFAAFYADCPHEVLPVTEGHRVTLVFNLFHASGGAPPGAPDYRDLAAPVADCLAAEWRQEDGVDKLVWLLEHEYSQDGLSFDTLKGTDAAVAEVLGEAAHRADSDLYAAVLKIEEYGMPAVTSVYGDWGVDWTQDEDSEMEEVHEHWETLDSWVARDGGEPPFGEIRLKRAELLPRGALDGAEPDERRLEESTGNEGPTLELRYRLAALVVWPRENTLDIVAGEGIDHAVAWAATQCEGVSGTDSDHDRGRRILARLIELWPVEERPYSQAPRRTAMLRLLTKAGDANLAADFLDRVVAAKYDGSENEALVSVLPIIGARAARRFLLDLVEERMPRRPGDVFHLLALVARNETVRKSQAWDDVLHESVETALARFEAALRAKAGPKSSARKRRWIAPQAVQETFALAWSLDLADAAFDAAAAIGDCPGIVAPDRVLCEALPGMHEHEALAGSAVYALLWRCAVDFLLERSAVRPSDPSDWTIAAKIACDCEDCSRLRAFCQNPVKRVERFQLRKDLRKHLHRMIDSHGLDLDHVTERTGRPFTLVCTKNRASHQRLLARYAKDARRMETLLRCAPPIETAGTASKRVVQLGEAIAASEGAR